MRAAIRKSQAIAGARDAVNICTNDPTGHDVRQNPELPERGSLRKLFYGHLQNLQKLTDVLKLGATSHDVAW